MLYPRANEIRSVWELSGVWDFQLGDEREPGEHCGAFSAMEKIAVPASYNDQMEDPAYRGHYGWVYYRRHFMVPACLEGQRRVLRFDAVAHQAKVYINGSLVTEHKGGFLPFEVEITDLVPAGTGAELVVAADDRVSHSTLPVGNEGSTAFFGSDNPGVPSVEAAKRWRRHQNLPNFDFFNYTGINRPVRLYTTPKAYIEDITLVPDIDGTTGLVHYKVAIAGDTARDMAGAGDGAARDMSRAGDGAARTTAGAGDGAARATAGARDGAARATAGAGDGAARDIAGVGAGISADEAVRIQILDQEGHVVAEGEGACGRLTIPDARLWWPWPGEPYLYTAFVTYGKDRYRQAFGIRTVKVEGTDFLINGKPFYFKGFGKHEDSPFHGRGLDLCLDVKDVHLMHWLQANSFRTSHYPYAEEMYDLCDQEGIVVIDETPAVGINGAGMEDPYQYPLKAHHEQVLREMIARDKNHPCVVMWSMGNEPDTEHFPQAALAYWTSLYHLTHKLDPAGRPVTFVCCQNDYEKDLVTRTMDVVCINRYYGWYNLSGDLDAACYALEQELDFWERQGKPVMLTEYGADAIPGVHQCVPEMFSEEYQMEFYKRQNACLDGRPFIVGEQVWNFADFATVQGCMRADGNKKGLLTRDRRPKLAAHYFRQRWGQIPCFGYKSDRT